MVLWEARITVAACHVRHTLPCTGVRLCLPSCPHFHSRADLEVPILRRIRRTLRAREMLRIEMGFLEEDAEAGGDALRKYRELKQLQTVKKDTTKVCLSAILFHWMNH